MVSTLFPLEGVIAFPVTPFTETGAIDLPGLRANLRRLIAHPLAAVVAAGGTGEVYSLSEAEHAEIVGATVEEVDGRVPVIAGVAGSVGAASTMAIESAERGAGAILALPPSYPGAESDGLLAYYQTIGASTALPLIVYSRDWVNPSPIVVERMATAIPTLAAWKDGTGDVRRYQQIISRLGTRLHWIGGAGDDLVDAYYHLGIRAYTSSIANVAPRLSLALHEAASGADRTRIRSLIDTLVVPLYELRGRRKGLEVSAMKAMMALQGQAAGPVRPPLVDVSPTERETLGAILHDWRDWL